MNVAVIAPVILPEKILTKSALISSTVPISKWAALLSQQLPNVPASLDTSTGST